MSGDERGELESFGARVRHFRQLRGLTQSELAEQVGLDRKTVNRLEGGLYSTSLRNVFVIATALGTDVTSLFDEQVPTTVEPVVDIDEGRDLA